MKRSKANGFYAKVVKRALDILLSAFALIVLSPILAVTALLVRIKLGSPIIFTQDRAGMNDRGFKLCKFRTMNNQTDENGVLLPGEMRLNRFGRLLRSTSLDELPELFNILKGDMSIVGPRPLLVQYLDRYNDHDRRRHEVRPGLTGLAQVSGRNSLPWKTRFEKDVEYVDNVTLLMDIKIILLTIKKVLVREGIVNSGHQPITEYFDEYGKERVTMV